VCWHQQPLPQPQLLLLIDFYRHLHRDLRILFFCVRIESWIESAVRFDFKSNFRIESAVYTTQAITPSNELHWYLFCICHKREWCTQLSTCYSFQFSPKMRQTMPLYDYLTPKHDFKRKFNHRQSFLYKGRLTVRTIRKFRIRSSLRIESRIGSLIRNRIKSRSFAGPYIYINLIIFCPAEAVLLVRSLHCSWLRTVYATTENSFVWQLVVVALWNRETIYIFMLWFVLSFFFFFFFFLA